MSTRSDIIVERTDGKWKRIYCHWDGYLSHNGRILFDHYNSQERAEALVEPGDLSSLDEECTKPEGHSYDNRMNGYSVYYGRDRGEEDVDGTVADSLAEVWPPEDAWTEYTYVWRFQKGWSVSAPREGEEALIPLGEALELDALQED